MRVNYARTSGSGMRDLSFDLKLALMKFYGSGRLSKVTTHLLFIVSLDPFFANHNINEKNPYSHLQAIG